MKWLFLLRALIPSWRFFDEAGLEPLLEVRWTDGPDEQETWKPCLEKVPRSLKSFPLNAKGNFLHACNNSIDHFVMDILANPKAEMEKIEQLISFRIVANLVQLQMQRMQLSEQKKHYQFRIDEIFLSRIYEV